MTGSFLCFSGGGWGVGGATEILWGVWGEGQWERGEGLEALL